MQPQSYHQPESGILMKAALWYASQRIPVFPCRPSGKEPLTERGFLDASTDARRIHAWWNRWPLANIGIPTGERSGLLVIDVDRKVERGIDGFGSLEALEAEHGELPATRTHRTGGGGIHHLYSYPTGSGIRNSADKLGRGVDVRGEGGYVIAPPSATTGPYERLEAHPRGEAPSWVLEALTEPQCAAGDNVPRAKPMEAVSIDGGPIPDGGRNHELTRIAGRLHDGSRSLERLAQDLAAINEARCQPPLPDREVRRIAASIHRRKPCNPAPRASEEVLEALDDIEAAFWRNPWPGMGWKSARSVMVVLITQARRHGTLIPAGVRVGIATRPLALAASVSHRSVLKAIRRLREGGVISKDDADRAGTRAGAFVLLRPRAKVHHSATGGVARAGESASGELLRAPFTAPRLRWSAPRWDRLGDEYVRTTVRRLGKGCEAVVDALERAGGKLTLEELADVLGVKRPRDLRRRYLEGEHGKTKLLGAGVVECSGNVVRLAGDWLEALNRERDLAGEVEAARRDLARYDRERDAYREHRQTNPDRAPTTAEMDDSRRARGQERADGFIGELERVEPSPAEGSADVEREPTRERHEEPSCDGAGLTAGEVQALAAIRAFEGKYGPGFFRWDHASCKAMFYSGPVSGCWPDPEQLGRIRAVYEAGGLEGAA